MSNKYKVTAIDRVQDQFGPNARAYVTSQVHEKGASLSRLLELTGPKLEWEVLDVATGAGHTAFAFAERVHTVMAIDITLEMLQQAQLQASNRGFTNIDFIRANALSMPFGRDRFDLISCRIAAHHFQDKLTFMRECFRVVRLGGMLALVDNVVPGSHQSGKRASALNQAGRYINAFEKLRDPSHVSCLSTDQWSELFFQNGFQIIEQEQINKRIDFYQWVDRMRVGKEDVIRLKVMLVQAPDSVREFLKPAIDGENPTFELNELVMVGRKIRDV